MAAAPDTQVVANADDPLVVWGAGAAHHVRWVGAGLRWRSDAVGCPACEGRIEFTERGWHCGECDFARPEPEAWLEPPRPGSGGNAGCLTWGDGRAQPFALSLPGRFNLGNAAMATVAAWSCGVDPADALAAMGTVAQVAGRFTVQPVGGVEARLMLAKNPAGWDELLDLVAESDSPLVVSINARTADGADPSWLWDVPFERLAGRRVVATGDRMRDLSVRLHYAGVEHSGEDDPVRAVASAVEGCSGLAVDVIGNYTAFHELLRARR